MKKFKKWLVKELYVLWQLPQSLIGAFLCLWYWGKVSYLDEIDDTKIVYLKNWRKGISLGTIVIVGEECNQFTINHELGHSKQSKYLGWLYIPIIGIPSLLHNIVYSQFNVHWSYYDFYTEKWAEYLAKKQF